MRPQAVGVREGLDVRLDLLVAAEAALVLRLEVADPSVMWSVPDANGGPALLKVHSQRLLCHARTPLKDRANGKSQKAMSSLGRLVRSDEYMLRAVEEFHGMLSHNAFNKRR